MNSLSVEIREKLEDETIGLLLEIYEESTRLKSSPPPIDFLYEIFKRKWLSETYDFISANADSWEVNMNEVYPDNLVEKMNEWGFVDFVIPSHIKIHQVLNYFGMSYVTNRNEVMNGSVTDVW